MIVPTCTQFQLCNFILQDMAGVLGLCCLLAVFANVAVADLKWPETYTTSGHIYLPYGDIFEPFTAWVDMSNSMSRMDTYGGTARLINRPDVGDYGTMFLIVPETTNDFANRITCFKAPGFKGAAISPQGVLPNISLYTYVGDYQYQGIDCEVYVSSFQEEQKNNTYQLLVRKDNQAPVILHFVGYDRLFGSHYDEYVVEYADFSAEVKNASVFNYQEKFDCRNFPGPGVTNPMGENPFFEFVGSAGYSDEDKTRKMEDDFKHFKNKHGKKYKNDKEEAMRKTHFRHNHRYINSMNRRDLTYKLAVNHMADYSDDEMKMMRGYRHDKTSPRGSVYMPQHRIEDVPADVDWWLRGAVTPVKDQGICGSCWSFGTTGTIEGSYFLKYKNLISFSEQSLVDCSWGYGNDGCAGGESERAYKWIIHNGCIPTEDSYGQYLMEDGFCKVNESICGASLTQWYNTPSKNVSALVLAIFEKGPISVAIDASHRSFGFYSYGVYYEPECGSGEDDLDHQVLAIGYGIQDGKEYFLVKNSWSTHYGMDGYILMSQRNNNCGIATDASFADIA